MSIKDLGNGKYLVRVYGGPHRREHRKVIEGKRAAQAHETQMKAKYAADYLFDPHAGKVTFRVYALRVIEARNLAPNTRLHYLRDCERLLFPLWGNRELRSLQHTDAVRLTAFVASKAKGAGGGNALVLARSIIRSAVLDGLLERNPFAGIKLDMPRPKAKALPDWPEVRTAVAKSTDVTGAVIAVLAGSGLRAGELAGLDIGTDIDWLRKRITVRQQLQHMTDKKAREAGYARGGYWLADVKTEAGGGRVVPLPDFAVEALSILAGRSPEPVTVAVDEPDAKVARTARLLLGLVDPAALSARIGSAAHRAGVGKVYAHAYRHLFVTTLEQGGVPLRTVQAVAGHAPQGVTLSVYAHVTEESLALVRQALQGVWDAGSPAAETWGVNAGGASFGSVADI